MGQWVNDIFTAQQLIVFHFRIQVETVSVAQLLLSIPYAREKDRGNIADTNIQYTVMIDLATITEQMKF